MNPTADDPAVERPPDAGGAADADGGRGRVARPSRAVASLDAPGPTPPSLIALAAAVSACRRCDLWRSATRAVPGEGPAHPRLMLVGEQPGDSEDLAGRPFVGPAGQLLDRALADAGVERTEVFVTNAVKHFKNEPRGKRRLHRTPDAGEVRACRWWLDQERALARPRLVVALGATAARAVFGKATAVGASRGRSFVLADGTAARVTLHPSALLRMPQAADRARAYAGFVEDLRAAAAAAAA